MIEAKGLLIQVTEEMERLDANIGSTDAALDEAPEILKTVCMNTAIDVLHGMVYDLMGVLPGESLIGEQRISVEGGTGFDMLSHFGLERLLLAVRDHYSADLSAALKDAHDSSLVFTARAGEPSHLPVDLLRPYPAEEKAAWPVSARVGNIRNNDPALAEPVP
jgi:hypothetical protein